LNDERIPSTHGNVGHWCKTGVINLLTNVKLIGYQERRTHGTRGKNSANTFTRLEQPIRRKANWDPIVPPKLFNAVQKEANRRKESDKRTRGDKSAFLLRPTCLNCGVLLSTTTVRGYRYYRHPVLKQPGRGPAKKKMMAADCGVSYFVRAETLEDAVYERILHCRSSEYYFSHVQMLV
jgi:hypothetical protein